MSPTKQYDHPPCETCGTLISRKRYNGRLEDFGVFQRRKHCDLRCAGVREHKPDPSWMTAHYHARRMVPKGRCQLCATPDALDVHHIDGNFQNNDRANLIRLCRSCHMKSHASHRRSASGRSARKTEDRAIPSRSSSTPSISDEAAQTTTKPKPATLSPKWQAMADELRRRIYSPSASTLTATDAAETES